MERTDQKPISLLCAWARQPRRRGFRHQERHLNTGVDINQVQKELLRQNVYLGNPDRLAELGLT